MKNNRLLMLFGRTRYDSMNNYLRELGNSFVKMGYLVDYLDGREPDFDENLYNKTSEYEYKAIFACNAILTGLSSLVIKNSVLCCLMFDHPAYLSDRLDIADERVIVIHCDLRGAEYIAKYFPNVGSVGFVPLSGKYIEPRIPYKERKYDVVFTGTNNSSDKIYEKEVSGLSPEDKKTADRVIDIMKYNPDLMIQDAYSDVVNEDKLQITDRHFHVMVKRMLGVENYMRAWLREQVIRSIVDSRIKLNVYGDEWDRFECEHPENIIRMGNDWKEALSAVADSRISLNVMPWFRGGFQERIATAMLSGSIALTDSSTYIEEEFVNGQDIVLYDRKNIADIPNIIRDLLDNPEKAEKIAQKGYEKAVNGHTWSHRAKEIMDIIDDSIEWLESLYKTIRENGIEGKRPKVSVIVPVYNSEKTLGNCLGNLVNQTLDDIEIIIVDDCSTDNSRKIIEDCRKQYPDRVKVVFRETNGGPGGARNTGLKYARGEYIGFTDSDDVADVTMYEKLYNEAVSGNYDIVDTGYYMEERDLVILYTTDECTGELDDIKRNRLIADGGGYLWSKIYRAELLEGMEKPFRENCILEYNDFIIYMYAKAKSIGVVKELLYVFKNNQSSATKTFD